MVIRFFKSYLHGANHSHRAAKNLMKIYDLEMY